MVLIGDIVGDDERRGGGGRSQVVRIANARGGEGFIAVSAEARKQILARPRAHRRHRQAHQRLQDQRGRGHSAARAWATTPTASSASTSNCRSRNKLALLDALDEFFPGELPLAQHGEALPAPRAARRPARGRARARRRSARALALAARQPRPAGRRRRAPTSCPALAAVTHAGRTRVLAAAGPQRARVLEGRSARRLQQLFDGLRIPPHPRAAARAIHQSVLKSARVRRAAHACRRRQRAHQHPGQLRRLRDAAARPTRAVARIMRLAKSLGGVISGEHGIGITKLEFLDADEVEAFRRYKEKVDPRRPLQRGQAARRRRSAQRLHARASTCSALSR